MHFPRIRQENLKTLLDDWIDQRPATLRTNLLFVDRGRRMPRSRVQHAIADCAHRTASGTSPRTSYVTRWPHTQAINRGMSREAIASRPDTRA